MKAVLVLLALTSVLAMGSADAATVGALAPSAVLDADARIHCEPGFEIICEICAFVAHQIGAECL